MGLMKSKPRTVGASLRICLCGALLILCSSVSPPRARIEARAEALSLDAVLEAAEALDPEVARAIE
jgi:hypothetical protein